MTITYLCVIIGFNMNIFAYVLLPFIVYPFAWTGHFYFEKNEPAAFKNPVLAKASDWVMLFDIIPGKIEF